ncbi:hypothetical protein [Caulobacter sp.]|uniref:hypothetical protein n=1 Tax=Caulobacter sp. TaxID=78 RepID=UPI002B472363|nr:hypothetical protein [Caulobacter sp.]HJV42420.1 hypothetical protein [Caulobacter sp.]
MSTAKRIYGLEPIVTIVALATATADAIIIPFALFFAVSEHLLWKVAISSGSVAALVFLRLLFSHAFHYAMGQANSTMQGGQPFRLKLLKFSDPDWGLTGAKWGSGYLVPLRLILMVEFLIVIFFSPDDHQWIALTAFSGVALAILLTQSQLTDHFRRPVQC